MARQRKTGKVTHIEKVWLSAKEARAYLDCGDTFLQKLRDNAEISFAKYGSKVYWYDRTSIDRFIQRNKIC